MPTLQFFVFLFIKGTSNLSPCVQIQVTDKTVCMNDLKSKASKLIDLEPN